MKRFFAEAQRLRGGLLVEVEFLEKVRHLSRGHLLRGFGHDGIRAPRRLRRDADLAAGRAAVEGELRHGDLHAVAERVGHVLAHGFHRRGFAGWAGDGFGIAHGVMGKRMVSVAVADSRCRVSEPAPTKG